MHIRNYRLELYLLNAKEDLFQSTAFNANDYSFFRNSFFVNCSYVADTISLPVERTVLRNVIVQEQIMHT